VITNFRGTTVAGVLDGHVVWATAEGEVVAAPLAAMTEAGSGEPTVLLGGVFVGGGGAGKLAMSDRGSIMYQAGDTRTRLVLVTPDGAQAVLPGERRGYSHPRWSPDGKRIAVVVRTGRTKDIWVYAVANASFVRLTNQGDSDFPEWTSDGARIVYRAVQNRGSSLRWMRADGMGDDRELVSAALNPYAGYVTPDQQSVVYRTNVNADETRRMLVMPIGGGTRREVIGSRGNEMAARLSPDGKLMAYSGNENGSFDVYVHPFATPGPGLQVSLDGGTTPIWSRDGQTLYYWHGRTLVAARIARTPSLSVVDRRNLFSGGFPIDPTWPDYDVAPDNRHFVVLESATDIQQSVVVLGWEREMLARLGVRR
jgi:eukaryotic-like serine/threonine-protein kinase